MDNNFLIVGIMILITIIVFSRCGKRQVKENFANEYIKDQCGIETGELKKINKHLNRYCSARETDFDKLNRVTLNNELDCRWYDNRAITHGWNKVSWCGYKYPWDIKNKRIVNSNVFLSDRERVYLKKKGINPLDLEGEKIKEEQRLYTGSYVDDRVNNRDDNIDGPDKYVNKDKLTHYFRAKNKPKIHVPGPRYGISLWNEPVGDSNPTLRVKHEPFRNISYKDIKQKNMEHFDPHSSKQSMRKKMPYNMMPYFHSVGSKDSLEHTEKYEFPNFEITKDTPYYYKNLPSFSKPSQRPKKIKDYVHNYELNNYDMMEQYVQDYEENFDKRKSIYENSKMNRLKRYQKFGENC